MSSAAERVAERRRQRERLLNALLAERATLAGTRDRKAVSRRHKLDTMIRQMMRTLGQIELAF